MEQIAFEWTFEDTLTQVSGDHKKKEIIGRGKIMKKGNKTQIVRPHSPGSLISFSRKLRDISIFEKNKWHHHIYGLEGIMFIMGVKYLCEDQLGGCCNCPGKSMNVSSSMHIVKYGEENLLK